MPTPNPGSETQGEFMERCVPMMMDEGMDNDQAVAACAGMWEDATKAGPDKLVRRAYSTLVIKAADDEKREITGIATTPSTDSYGDVVEPTGAEFNLPLPLLWQHDSSQPIGHVTKAKVTKSGIEIVAKLVRTDEAGRLKERLDEAWQSIKLGLVRGLSIGFRSIEHAFMEETFGIHFLKWRWLELSAVTIPANADASIATIKSLDTAQLAASGRVQRGVAINRPGVSGASPHGREANMNIAEHIAQLDAARAAKLGRLNAINEEVAKSGETKDSAQQEEFDTLTLDIEKLDKEIADQRKLEALNLSRATELPKNGGATPAAAAAARAPQGSIRIERTLPKGTAFTRYVMALSRAKGNADVAANIAKRLWHDSTPEVELVLRAAAEAGTTTDADWAAKLVDYTNIAGEFIELLRPMTILGKFGQGGIPALRQVPFNIRMATQTAGGTYGWVGEGAPKPVGELTIGEFTMRWAKAAGIIVVTDELMRFSSPAVEGIVRNDMLRGMAQFLDLQFVDPAVAEVANVSPASITNGVSPVASTGNTAEDLRTDIGTLLEVFFAANLTPSTGVWIMSNRMAMRIGLIRNALGQKEFPDITPMGGTLEGFPVIASETIAADTAGDNIILVNADDIAFADDGPVTIDASREASLQMDSAPDSTTSASTVLVSLWQRNMIALRAERYVNWKKRRAEAVQYINNANYALASS